jgi:hypothetical protein
VRHGGCRLYFVQKGDVILKGHAVQLERVAKKIGTEGGSVVQRVSGGGQGERAWLSATRGSNCSPM